MASTSISMKDYLKRYGAADDDKKKEKKKKTAPKIAGKVVVVDEDPVWQKPVQIEEESESSGDEKPLVHEDIEVKRMKRLEALRARKPYHGISEDGSGWVSISNNVKRSDSVERGGDDDLSPPRPRRSRSNISSPRLDSGLADEENPDLSPPRQWRRRADTPETGQKAMVAGEPDISPPRRRQRHIDTPSPEPALENDVSASHDLSPPRKRRHREETPTRDNLDLSPLRQRRRQADTHSSENETRMTHRHMERASRRRQESEDISPPRKGSQNSTQLGDLSPPRQARSVKTEDLSPPRRSSMHSKEHTDLSPPRRQKNSAVDLSPPRRSSKGSTNDLSPPRRAHHEISRSMDSAADLSPNRKVKKEASPPKEPKWTGLFSAQEFKEENNRKRKEENSRSAASDDSKAGKGAPAVFRDKDGKRITKEELLKAQEEAKPKEIKLEWGKGLAQKREAEARARELELEKAKPFARTSDDPDLDKMLKERVRWGDPMAHLVKRKNPQLELEDLGDDEKMKESGFIIPQTIPSHSWIKRGIDCPPNRYGIRPGRHWDGVDRSNGFEKDAFKRQNERRASEREAYLWSVSDM